MHKIAAYAICKNHAKFLEKSLFAVSTADYIFVLDNGSTDDSAAILNNLGMMLPQMKVITSEPLEYLEALDKVCQELPSDADIAIPLDLEAIFPSNWRECIEEDFDQGYNKILCNSNIKDMQCICALSKQHYWYNENEPDVPNVKPFIDERLTVQYMAEPNNSPLPDYKIAVYTICKDEINNVDEWFKSMKEADYICVLDTGSIDGTYEKLLEYQKADPERVFIGQKIFNPWRFDTSRNESMKLIPAAADICISTDLDERLTPTWSEKLKRAWKPGCQRAYYLYAWSHLPDGTPARTFWYDKVHVNSGMWKFKFPVHEALWHPIYGHANLQPYQVCRLPADFIMLHHYPDRTRNKSNYLDLLKIRFEENPNDFYTNLYLAHEYKYQKQWQNCIDFIHEHTIPYLAKHKQDKIFIANTYMFLGDCYAQLGNSEKAIEEYKKGIEVDPTYRENYTQLGKLYVVTKQNRYAIGIIHEGLTKSRKHNSWLELDISWSSEPWDILAAAYYNEGAIHAAQQCATMAYMLNRGDERLKQNYEALTQEVQYYEYRPKN